MGAQPGGVVTRLALIVLSFSLSFLVGCPGSSTPPVKVAGAGKTKSKKTKPKPKPKKPFVRKSLKTPWAKAKVGEWAVYKMSSGENMRFEVMKVEERTVSWGRTDKEGKPKGSLVVEDLAKREEKYEGAEKMGLVDKTKLKSLKMKIGEKEIDVRVVVRNAPGGGSATNWVTKVVPPFMGVGGDATAKSIRDGGTMFELVDFGSK
jgi:hypothetical protein